MIDLLLPFFGERRRERAAMVLTRAYDSPFEGWDADRDDTTHQENLILQFDMKAAG